MLGTSLAAGWRALPAATVWDGIYSAAQAERGADTFSQNCAGCHGRAGGGTHGGLWGEGFWRRWREASVGDLYQYLRDNMPNDDPGDLQEADYLDLIAYILSRNDLPAGARDLTPAAADSIAIVARTGRALLPDSTLVAVTGCLARGSGGDWVLSGAARPLRVNGEEQGAPDPRGASSSRQGAASTASAAPAAFATSAAAARARKGRSFLLKYVIGSLDALAGHRVRVTGLLIGDGGASGINFMTASGVADHC